MHNLSFLSIIRLPSSNHHSSVTVTSSSFFSDVSVFMSGAVSFPVTFFFIPGFITGTVLSRLSFFLVPVFMPGTGSSRLSFILVPVYITGTVLSRYRFSPVTVFSCSRFHFQFYFIPGLFLFPFSFSPGPIFTLANRDRNCVHTIPVLVPFFKAGPGPSGNGVPSWALAANGPFVSPNLRKGVDAR